MGKGALNKKGLKEMEGGKRLSLARGKVFAAQKGWDFISVRTAWQRICFLRNIVAARLPFSSEC